ncbi:MAG: xanthine dehydrogenase family protein subunit M [Deltaproteobacteria bacterium]|nr:xanthine dehydrogenase family protein subunit M [Deltaproteobacteria bacterium]
MSSRILPQFALLTPQSISEAVDMLAQYQGQVSVLAGGTDLLVWNYIRKVKPTYVLRLSALDDLDYMNYIPGEGLRIGARAKVAQLLEQPEVAGKFPALYESALTFATPQIRNMATVMGNVLRASPAGDCSCAILALGGQVVLQGPDGQRLVDIDDFWISYGVTARKNDELAVELRIPEPTSITRSAFYRLTRVHEDLAKLNVAVRFEMCQNGCRSARISMGCVGPTPLRLKQTEKLLEGVPVTDELLQQVAAAARKEIAPIADQRSTEEYRRQVSGVILTRVIERAAGTHRIAI